MQQIFSRLKKLESSKPHFTHGYAILNNLGDTCTATATCYSQDCSKTKDKTFNGTSKPIVIDAINRWYEAHGLQDATILSIDLPGRKGVTG